MTPRWPKMDYDGFKMASRCPRIGHWGHLGPPWGLLGASSGPTWRHFGPTWGRAVLHKQNYQFSLGFFHGFKVSTGPSWGHVGAILAHLGALLGHLGAILGHLGVFVGPFWAILGVLGLDTDWQYLFHRCRDSSRGLSRAILGPFRVPRWPVIAPRWPQDGQTWAHDGSKMSPRWPQDGPRWPQDGPNDPFPIVVVFLEVLF